MRLRNTVAKSEGEPLIELVLLKKGEDQGVEVIVVEDVDFTEVKRRLERGEPVSIILKRKQELGLGRFAREDTRGPWYFSHV